MRRRSAELKRNWGRRECFLRRARGSKYVLAGSGGTRHLGNIMGDVRLLIFSNEISADTQRPF